MEDKHPCSFLFLIKYITHALNENASKRKLCNTHRLPKQPVCCQLYLPSEPKHSHWSKFVSASTASVTVHASRSGSGSALSPAAGCSAAPPGRRRRRPGRPGARPSCRRPPPGCLRCWGDLKSAKMALHVGKGRVGRVHVQKGWSFLTRQLVGQIETQLVQHLGYDCVAEAKTN